jgi:hypothetical protein
MRLNIACLVNPESVLQCDGMYEAGRCHAADTCRKTTNRDVLFELLAKVHAEAYHCTFREFCINFSVFICEWPL